MKKNEPDTRNLIPEGVWQDFLGLLQPKTHQQIPPLDKSLRSLAHEHEKFLI